MRDALDFDEFEVVPPLRPVTIVLDVSAADLELALTTNGASLRRPLMTALLAAMTVDSDSA